MWRLSILRDVYSGHDWTNISGDDGSLEISLLVDQLTAPSWSLDCREEGGRRERILYLILIKDRGKEGRQRRRRIRETWTASLPPGHRYVFLLAGEALEDVEAESEQHDDLVLVDISRSVRSPLSLFESFIVFLGT